MMMAIDASKIVNDLALMIEENGDSVFVRARDILNKLFAAKIVPQGGKTSHKEIVCPNCGAQMERSEE